MLKVRLYIKKDEDAVLGIFRSNMPKYFDPSEYEPFQRFLKDIKGKYFVCELQGRLCGAGGYYETDEGEARICWLMVNKALHGKGVGRFLMEEFERQIVTNNSSNRITLKTTQHVDKFYESLGYSSTQFEEDFWAKGLHLCFMQKAIKNP